MMRYASHVLTVEEAAPIARHAPYTVRRWIREGKLPAQKVGGKYLIQRTDIEALAGISDNRTADFSTALADSHTKTAQLHRPLMRLFGALAVHDPHPLSDKAGVDLWIECAGYMLGVDLKHRSGNHHDCNLELLSDIATHRPGWAVDPAKRADWIVWCWPDRLLAARRADLCALLNDPARLAELSRCGHTNEHSSRDGGRVWAGRVLYLPPAVLVDALPADAVMEGAL